ncbi:glycosyltransferase family 4 protein [Hydrogenobacter hydrogenophilus]|uniref:Glycosyltransferase involved in cell wall bisynthesis n=1 Tax=Hydrogenobacter hydrogenophilus TaxID=35835 RepID=A0A285NV77_9AQUI|nr:glycosyltransferase family 4 protein [Hydrogenobacter hydrogenophilus]SNZ11561.1 Glycosyltransferase involved in cell wall bisynthesis [Hydrogenobacter hydrogenophilus]
MQAVILNLVDPFKFRGGIERVVLHLMDMLSEEGYSIELIHADNSQKIGSYSPYWVGRQAYFSEKSWDLAIVNNLSGLGLFPGKAKKTVAIIHGLYTEFFENRVISEEDIQEMGVDYWEYLVNRYLNGYLAEAFVLNSADLIIAVCQRLKEAIQRQVEKHVVAIPNPVDPIFQPMDKKKIREMYNIPKDALVGLFVGRNDYTKGYDVFRELVRHTYKDILWVQAISSGSSDSYEPVRDIIAFREVSFEEMPIIYNLADFLVFPSRYEGFALSILEALACGIPVITSKSVVSEEIIDLLNGFLVAELSVEEFLRRIEVIKKYKVIRDHYREYISKEVRRRFSIELWKERMREALLS